MLSPTHRLALAACLMVTALGTAQAYAAQKNDSSQEKTDMPPRVLFVLTSHDRLGDTGESTGFYLSEVTHPYEVFQERGYQIDFVSPRGGKAPMDGVNLEDPTNKRLLEDETFRTQIDHTRKPAQVKAEDYDAIYFAGGHGTMWDLPDNEALINLAASVYEQGSVVGAVCHGPAGLVNVRLSDGSYLVEGREVAAFTNEEEEARGLTDVVPFLLESKLEERGAEHTQAPDFKPHVVVSDRLVTGQNPASARGAAEKMVELIEANRKSKNAEE